MDKQTTRKVFETGRYWYKDRRVRIESNDFGVLADTLQRCQPPSFDAVLDSIINWTTSILEGAGIPAALDLWNDSSGAWISEKPEKPMGAGRIDAVVEKYMGHDAESIIGIASKAFAAAMELKHQMRKDVGPRSLYLGMLVERLHASKYLDARTDKANEQKTAWKGAATTLYHELVRGGKILPDAKLTTTARALLRQYEKRHGKFPRSLRTLENHIKEIQPSKKA